MFGWDTLLVIQSKKKTDITVTPAWERHCGLAGGQMTWMDKINSNFVRYELSLYLEKCDIQGIPIFPKWQNVCPFTSKMFQIVTIRLSYKLLWNECRLVINR